MAKPVITLNECVNIMRDHGFRMTASRLRDDIESGAYPFGRIISIGPNGRRQTEIYRVKLEAWLKEMGCDVK